MKCPRNGRNNVGNIVKHYTKNTQFKFALIEARPQYIWKL